QGDHDTRGEGPARGLRAGSDAVGRAGIERVPGEGERVLAQVDQGAGVVGRMSADASGATSVSRSTLTLQPDLQCAWITPCPPVIARSAATAQSSKRPRKASQRETLQRSRGPSHASIV